SCTGTRRAQQAWGARRAHGSRRDSLSSRCARRTCGSTVPCMIRCATQAACRRTGAKRVRGMRIQVRDGGEFSCEVTGFHGYEQETLAYLDWRYRRSADSPEPQVFWLLTPERQRIGMASVVFRPYWSNNTRVQTAVVGDISLDTRWRGRGLGQALLRFMTEY